MYFVSRKSSSLSYTCVVLFGSITASNTIGNFLFVFQILRKKYYNMVEDMKGKIRVYARCRPLSTSEKDRVRSVELHRFLLRVFLLYLKGIFGWLYGTYLTSSVSHIFLYTFDIFYMVM